ncbi:MAG TPA: nucleotidyltransferase family protein [Acetobacteraceae bacterium]|nr:nucleotidyltransferase family protein [Acetobacteraceae bacterium]
MPRIDHMSKSSTLREHVEAAVLTTARPPTETEASRGALAECLPRFNEADWAALIDSALSQGTASLLCRHLLNVGPELVPRDVGDAASAFLAMRASAAVDAMTQLASVVDALSTEGIDALPYKGPVLALQAYHDPAMRTYRDLDFLVRQEYVWQALGVLEKLGYRSDAVLGLRARRIADYYHYNGHDILFGRYGLPLEPHWSLSPRTFCTEIDTGQIFTRATSVESQGFRFACFSPEDSLLVAAVHGGKEQWSRLIWAADIAALLHSHPDLDWTAVFMRASRTGCLRMTLLAAALSGELLGAPLPEVVCLKIAEDHAVARLVAQVRANLFSGQESPSVFTLTSFRWNLRERLADRVRYASRTLFAARVPHFRNVDLPDPLSFMYPAVRLAHDFVAIPVWRALNRKSG